MDKETQKTKSVLRNLQRQVDAIFLIVAGMSLCYVLVIACLIWMLAATN